MRYAVISDIHANIEALDAVLEAITDLEVDKIVCCGDLVGYLANPNECVARVRDRKIISIAGNHDLAAAGKKRLHSFWQVARHAIIWSRRELSQENIEYLQGLPSTALIDDRLLLFHGSLHPQSDPEDLHLENDMDIRLSFEALKKLHPSVKLAFFGHLHVPCIYSLAGDRLEMPNPADLVLDDYAIYFINPGSVGLSRDDNPRPSFLIYDASTSRIQFQRIEHSHEAAQHKARLAGLMRPNPVLAFLRRLARKLCKIVQCADIDY